VSEYAAWLDVLPEALRDSATGEALQAIVDLDLGQHRAAARLWTGLSRAFPPRTAGCPQGPQVTPRACSQIRGGRSAMRGSPPWTPWTTRSASAASPSRISQGGQFQMSFDS